jgi:hypothetical protein
MCREKKIAHKKIRKSPLSIVKFSVMDIKYIPIIANITLTQKIIFTFFFKKRPINGTKIIYKVDTYASEGGDNWEYCSTKNYWKEPVFV